MIKPELSTLDISGLDSSTIPDTEQLRIYSRAVLAMNVASSLRVVLRYASVIGLTLRGPDGRLDTIIPEIDPENRVMLNDLYKKFGLDNRDATVEEFETQHDTLLIRQLGLEGDITFVETYVETYDETGQWSTFNVRACTPDEASGILHYL